MIKFKIRSKIMFLVLLPMLIILIGIFFIIRDNLKAMNLCHTMSMNSVCFEAVKEVISEIQRERGRTSVFLQTKDETEMMQQRQKTDERKNSFVAALNASSLSQEQKNAGAVLMNQLTDLRQKIGAEIQDSSMAVSAYSHIIEDLLGIMSSIANAPSSHGLGKVFSSMVILASAGENAGILRATVSAIITADKPLSSEQISKIIFLRSGVLLNLYSKAIAISSTGSSNILDFKNREHWKNVEIIISRITERAAEGNFGLDRGKFWKDVSQVVDDINGLMNSEIQLLLNRAKSIEADASAQIWIYALGFPILLVFLTVGSVWFADSLIKPILKSVHLLKDVALNGNIENNVPLEFLKRDDEVGELSQSVAELIKFQKMEVGVAKALAEGLWTVDIAVRSGSDELGLALKTMVEKVSAVLASVKESVEDVKSGSEQISDASQSLSQGATETAASLEEISASLIQIGEKARLNAESSDQTNRLTRTTRAAAENGANEIKALQEAMDAITNASGQIAKIIKTIDDIAFQTNLLALNAAVEAARAGRHGKGFAVVADEVRALAARSAKASRETADIIDGSLIRVAEGNKVVASSAKIFQEIAESVDKAGTMVEEMALASRDQAQAISEISIGLSQIDKVTQQNTANAEETAAATVELSDRGEKLLILVNQFSLKSNSLED